MAPAGWRVDHGANVPQAVVMPGETLGEPMQAATLAALDRRIAELTDPGELLALATEIDQLGMELAYEITRLGSTPELVAPLKPVLINVPKVHARALLRAAERFDDVGSPRRAAYVLLEALLKSFDPDTINVVNDALSFILEAHGQTEAAGELRALVAARADHRAAGADRRQLRAQFVAAVEALRARIEWHALEDEPGVD